jgi:hypothetical protein
MNDPGGRERMLALGTRSIPLLVRDSEFVVCQALGDVAKFIGMHDFSETKLAPDVLMKKWRTVLSAGQRYIRQFPSDRLDERLIDSRDQSIRHMGYHVFRIGHAFLETVLNDVEDWVPVSMAPPPAELRTGEDVADYGESVKQRLDEWWRAQTDKSCSVPVKTASGVLPVADLLQRQTWHSAQHVRQLAAVLERFGLEPDGRLESEVLAGLPLPAGLWE